MKRATRFASFTSAAIASITPLPHALEHEEFSFDAPDFAGISWCGSYTAKQIVERINSSSPTHTARLVDGGVELSARPPKTVAFIESRPATRRQDRARRRSL